MGNADGSYHATRDERERCNDMWVSRHADSGGRNTTATSAHIDHLEVCAEFKQTRNAVSASNAAYPFTFFSHISDSNGRDRSSRSISRSSGKVGGPQIGGMTKLAAHNRAGIRRKFSRLVFPRNLFDDADHGGGACSDMNTLRTPSLFF